MGFLRVLGLFFLFLLALHLVLRIVLRLSERRRLAEEWEAGPREGDRDEFVRAGMEHYDHSLKKRLLWLVIILPMAGLMVLLYVLNVS